MDIELVGSLDDPRLEVFTALTDSQLRNKLEPEKGIFIAESEKVVTRALDAGLEPVAFLMEDRWLDVMDAALKRAKEVAPDAPIFVASRPVMEQITGYDVTRGALSAFRRKPLPTVEEVTAPARRIAVLEDITNAANVGSIFRSAAALGVDGVLVTPGCCDPLYRRSVRVSMGTVFQIPWTYIGTDVKEKGAHGNTGHKGGWATSGIPQLQARGFEVAALALTDNSISIDDPALKQTDKLAFILGTEGDGLADATIALCDHTVKIPMFHGVDSLNVGAASAVAFWELRAG